MERSCRSISFYLDRADRPWMLAEIIKKLVKLSAWESDFRMVFFLQRGVRDVWSSG